MRLISALIATAVIASPAFAQEVKIKGNTNIAAAQNNTAAIAVGKNNKASNEAGVIGGK